LFCANCAAALDQNAAICVKCGVLRTSGNAFCRNCGKAHDPAADYCMGCGASLAAPIAPGTSASAVVNTAFAFTAQAPGNAIPEELTRRWSWGGFLLWLFWPWWNANTPLKWLTAGAFILSSFTAGLSGLALAIYFGISGNKIAARDRRFTSTDQFIAIQRAWAKAGVILLIVGCVAVPVLFALGAFSAIVMGILGNRHPSY
jgi:hypothetical protein